MFPADPAWPETVYVPALARDAVLLFRIAVPSALPPAALATLSPDEHARAERLKAPAAARRFVTARVALRQILGACAGLSPSAVPIRTTDTGKPRLPDSGLEFNVSHTGDLVLIALARGGPVGVDAEPETPPRAWADIAARVFTADERRELEAAPPGRRGRCFVRLWTRKEALAKFTGAGIWALLRETAPSSTAGASAPLLADLAPAPGYLGALAYAPAATTIRNFTWSFLSASPEPTRHAPSRRTTVFPRYRIRRPP